MARPQKSNEAKRRDAMQARIKRQSRAMARGFGDAMEAAGGDPGQVQQLPLMPIDEPAPAPLDPVTKRGPGRPEGSPNKSSAEWASYLLTRFRSPLIGLASMMSRDVLELAAELDCSPMEAAALQVDCMVKLLPYTHQKLPEVKELRRSTVFNLSISLAAGGELSDADRLTIAGKLVDGASEQSEQNQRVIDAAPAESDSGESDNGE